MIFIDGDVMDMYRICELSKKGVFLMLVDSINVEKLGFIMFEKIVGVGFDELFVKGNGRRIIVVIFVFNIYRL